MRHFEIPKIAWIRKPVEWFILWFVWKGLANFICRCFFRMDVKGQVNVPLDKPVILAANHVSNLDGPLLQLIYPRKVVFFLAAEFYHSPWAHWLFEVLDCVPVHEGRDNPGVIELGVKTLRRGLSVGIFPEGGRSRTGKLKRVRLGISVLAKESGAPVVPVWIGGSMSILPFGAWFPRPLKLTLRVGPPIFFREGEKLFAFALRLQEALLAMAPSEARP